MYVKLWHMDIPEVAIQEPAKPFEMSPRGRSCNDALSGSGLGSDHVKYTPKRPQGTRNERA